MRRERQAKRRVSSYPGTRSMIDGPGNADHRSDQAQQNTQRDFPSRCSGVKEFPACSTFERTRTLHGPKKIENNPGENEQHQMTAADFLPVGGDERMLCLRAAVRTARRSRLAGCRQFTRLVERRIRCGIGISGFVRRVFLHWPSFAAPCQGSRLIAESAVSPRREGLSFRACMRSPAVSFRG